MNARTSRIGVAAGGLGVIAGLAEIVFGTVWWAGNKNDPVTLGTVTVVLGLLLASATYFAHRNRSGGSQLAVACGLLGGAVFGLTTAGLAWVPAAISAGIAGVLTLRHVGYEGSVRADVRRHWSGVLVAVLALVYLTFGIVARGVLGVWGVAGAVAVVVALVLRRRSRPTACVVLVLGAVPFGAAAIWTVVAPMTALLLLAIGIPYCWPASASRRGSEPALEA